MNQQEIRKRLACRTPALVILVLAIMTGLSCTPPEKRTVGPPLDRDRLDAISQHEEARDADPEFFATMLAHENPHVRRAAARALGRIQDHSSLQLLVQRAEDPYEEKGVLLEVAFALGQLHSARAYPALTPLVEHDSARVRGRAVEAIGKLKVQEGEDALPADALLLGLRDADPEVRGYAALALGRRGEVSAVPQLSDCMAPEEFGEVRWRAAYALMQIEDPATLPPLRRALLDPDPWVRCFAAWGMRHPADPMAVKKLGELLADPHSHWTARAQAVLSLRELRGVGDEVQVREVLLEHLAAETHPLVLESVLEALARGGEEQERSAIASTLEGSVSPTVERAALIAYGQVGGDESLERFKKYVEHEDPLLRAAAAQGLGFCGAGALPMLSVLLRDPDRRVRQQAVTALGEMEGEKADVLLMRVTEDADLAVRYLA
ncbi:MAG: HEAT repeat domain-containing protein, partial [Planctomycetota bacterium]